MSANLIEQAALRLEQLRRAGASIEMLDGVRGAPGRGLVLPERAADPGELETPKSRQVDVDIAGLAARGILVPNAPRTALADQFRVLKRPLLRNAVGKGGTKVANGNLIMVTSALEGEGKTFTAINLAMSLAAEVDHTVMLIDADVERPSIAHTFGLVGNDASAMGPALLDILEGHADMSEVLLRTNIDKLTLLPSGMQRKNATELLASDAMTRLLEQMTSRYPERIIIFDSPPLLPTTEARVLASHMGQIVMVVHAEKTLQSKVQSALAMIETCPVRLLVLNRARDVQDATYGYGYGYGADKRTEDNNPQQTPKT